MFKLKRGQGKKEIKYKKIKHSRYSNIKKFNFHKKKFNEY